MPKDTTRVKKPRSKLRQMQTQWLPQARAKCKPIETPSESTPPTCVPKSSESSLDNIIKHKNHKIELLSKSNKKLAQRDKRAKSKASELVTIPVDSETNYTCTQIDRLQAQADLACESLSDACQARGRAENVLNEAHRRAEAGILEIRELQEQVERLQEQVTERSRSLVITSLELETQLGRFETLEIRQRAMNCSRDAMRKKIERANVRKGQHNCRAGSSLGDEVHEYHLKGPAGVIHPETRDMIRKLACQGVSTERISEVINIVAEGMGTRIIGSVSARSIA